ncbi:hypothetical protein [Phenylobacterium sp.]|uniref:hypothetical protein n=1 Tax=Phenylobacterium sp. TaxID=1871053 RepID=UPI002BAA07D7|nr:hypothetical protein [Phenylobacterium sp.]HLZ77084.1 hypothetical protein [Phenylobacterium sp.]
MSVLTILGLVYIVSMFAAFMIGLGGVSLWMALADRRDRMAQAAQGAQTPAPSISDTAFEFARAA